MDVLSGLSSQHSRKGSSHPPSPPNDATRSNTIRNKASANAQGAGSSAKTGSKHTVVIEARQLVLDKESDDKDHPAAKLPSTDPSIPLTGQLALALVVNGARLTMLWGMCAQEISRRMRGNI